MVKGLAVVSLAILLASFVFTIAMPVGKAQAPSMRVYIDPPTVENVSLVPGTTFNISVMVDNIPASPGLAGIQYTLSWNSSLLNGVNQQEVIYHETMPPNALSNLWMLEDSISADSAQYAYTYVNTAKAISGGYAPINGSHTVTIITLKVVGTGECAIHFESTIFGDPQANLLTYEVDDGFFSNLPSVSPPPTPEAALLYVNPATVINWSPNFTVSINVVNASGLSSLEFELGFNASDLQANSVASGSFIPSSATPITQIDNTAAFVGFNVSLSTPLNGNGTLAVIQFQVQPDCPAYVQNSTLHLYNVTLLGSTGQALPFSTVDGSFTHTVMGDLNGDGVVDIKDALLAAEAFESSPGDPNWNPNADLGGFGIINIIDEVLLAMNFGHTA